MIRIVYPVKDKYLFEEPLFHTFAGGEEHVKITPRENLESLPIILQVQLLSAADIMRLLLVTDALRICYDNPIELFMPYTPYARQDRSCNIGDPFSLRVFANLINSQEYSKVTIVDPHSPGCNLINNLEVIPHEIGIDGVNSRLSNIDYIVSPDMGASRKAKDWLYVWNSLGNNSKLLKAVKQRNIKGEIVSTRLDYPSRLDGCRCLIVDDICDGGRTFTELAKVLRDRGATHVFLYVTHGIFSKTLPLDGIDTVFTTDSLPWNPHAKVVKRFYS